MQSLFKKTLTARTRAVVSVAFPRERGYLCVLGYAPQYQFFEFTEDKNNLEEVVVFISI